MEGIRHWPARPLGTVAAVEDRRVLTVIDGWDNRMDGFEISEPKETERPIGTVATIDSFLAPPIGLVGLLPRARSPLRFAIALEAYPIKIYLRRHRAQARRSAATPRRLRLGASTRTWGGIDHHHRVGHEG